MAVTTLAEVTNQIQTFWSPLFTQELRENLLLGGLVNKDYSGEIKKGGDTVRVSQLLAPEGDTLTVGVDADSFETEALSMSYIDIKADKRFVASYEFEDLSLLQSQLGDKDSEIRTALRYAMAKQINKYLYSLVAASASAPDHVLNGVSDLNAAQLEAIRVLAGEGLWRKDKAWYGLLSPSFYMDVGSDTTMSSSDYNGSDPVIVQGEISSKRFGFNLVEDNYLPADHGLFFYEDFLHWVMQRDAQFKVSDLHAQKKFGFVISVDLIGGAKLGIDGDKKHIQVYNSAWAPNG